MFAVALGLTLAIGCGGGATHAKHATAGDPAKPEVAATPEADVPASPNLAVSMDIAEACHIAAERNINPRFQYNRDDLLSDDRAVLGTIAKCLTDGDLKGRTVNLIGRADPRGTDEYNLALGSRRSNTVSAYMAKLGIRSAQVMETTRGAMDATGTTEAGWRKDRRVDIVLVAPSS